MDVDCEVLNIGDLAIKVDGHSVERHGVAIELTPLEFDLLTTLARRPWQVHTREALFDEVWGSPTMSTPEGSTKETMQLWVSDAE